MVSRIGGGKALVGVGFAWLGLGILTGYTGSGENMLDCLVIAIPFWIIGGALWGWGRRKMGAVEDRLIEIEDLVRKARRSIVERDLSSKLETRLENIRAEISDLYSDLNYGDDVDRVISDMAEYTREINRATDTEDAGRVGRQIGLLEDRVADLRSLFERK